ncbi:MAG: hypothetical protein J3K34DRAFT_475967 [Monoraphidium minutum]|nr:MAG: hypothetical protein J3K34DRAFT_475967 [Monoraphidium minutum]
MNEAQLKPLFDQWGSVRDVMILRERSTGLSRGCAFVGFDTAEEAQAAIQHLDHRVHLPNALGPLEVRFARGRHASSGAGVEEKRQLAFSGAPPGATEGELLAVFGGTGGIVESVSLSRDPDTRESKGSGTATFATRQEAQAALDAMDGKVTMDGAAAPLTVRWVEAAPRRSKGGDGRGDDVDDRTVFFARVLRSATEESVRALFSRFGRVSEINLFRAFQGAPTTKGCGLATMGSAEEATAAIAGLHEQHTWQGMAQPMVVRWMDSALQRRRREEHISGRQPAPAQAPASYLASYSAPSNLVGARGGLGGAPGGPAAGGGGLLSGPHVGLSDAASAQFAAVPAEVPPPGCAPDAYKLFIGNVPSCYNERDLRPLFESVGPVVELVVLYDKQTGASKGSAFAWYAARHDADRAAQQFNERHLLPDPTGHQQRPLVVRPATVRRAVPRALLGAAGGAAAGGGVLGGGLGGGGLGGGGLGGGGLGGGGLAPHYGLAGQRGGLARVMHPLVAGGGGPSDSGGGGFSSSSFLMDGSSAFGGGGAGHDPSHVGDAVLSGGYAIGGGSGPDSGGYAVAGMAVGGGGGGWDASGGGASGQLHQLQYVPMAQQAALPSMARGGDGSEVLTVQVPLLASQLQAVTPHVFSIQSASGAEVMTQAVAPGVFCLRLSGSKLAVDTASQLISSVIQGAA